MWLEFDPQHQPGYSIPISYTTLYSMQARSHSSAKAQAQACPRRPSWVPQTTNPARCRSCTHYLPQSSQWASFHISWKAGQPMLRHVIPPISVTPSLHNEVGDVPSNQAKLVHLKGDLLRTVSSPQDTADLLNLVSALAALNPTPNPETSPLMNGRWVLLYTSNAPGAATAGANPATPEEKMLQSISPFQALSDQLYKIFYSYLPILAGSATGKRGSIPAPSLGPAGGAGGAAGGPERTTGPVPLVRSRGNFQTFNVTAGTVSNEARFDLLGSPASITVVGTAEVVPAGGGVRDRLRAMFTAFTLTVDGQQRVSLPLAVPNLLKGGALQGPVGYVDTCYLDQQLRISSGDKGSLFITVRDGEEDDSSNSATEGRAARAAATNSV